MINNFFKRRTTRAVMVGSVGVGGSHPVRIQSMTTSPTHDVDATVEQILKLQDAGCEIVRVTVQGKREARATEAIKERLVRLNVDIPLVADIHFYPPAAMEVVEFVDKVRINPGNFFDKRATFKVLEYTDASYQKELEEIEELFSPLVVKAKKFGRSMRIGTNHGSLSDRVLNRFGDTPRGMVESALEYARIARKLDYHELIFSMKASNPLVMIQAYRLLVEEMDRLGWDYPLHLGVTEAGEGEDGRIKSAIGMGTLLLEGLGDTIRVSLTEDPWYEIDPCRRLIEIARPQMARQSSEMRKKSRILSLPNVLHPDGSVGMRGPVSDEERGVGTASKADFVLGVGESVPLELALKGARFSAFRAPHEMIVVEGSQGWEELFSLKPSAIILKPPVEGRVAFCRKFFEWLEEEVPVLLNFSYEGEWEDVVIRAAVECGSLLADGFGDGLILEGPFPAAKLRELSFNILQGARRRSFKTEFISCPSCGRTLFNLQQVSERIRKRTGHLAGVKIAVMGCIVNGPGEMADADFGYVGSKTGKVDLYVGKECVEKNIDHLEADERLIELIKAHGRWEEG